MIYKLIGAILIIFTAYCYGCSISAVYKNRVKRLEELLLSLEIFKAEINYGLSMLPEVFRSIGNKLHSPIGSLFSRSEEYMMKKEGFSAEDCWHKSLAEIQEGLELNQDQFLLLKKMGLIWGKGDKSDQMRQVVLMQELLRQALQEAREDRVKNEKMWRYLGLLGGCTIVILLL